MSFPVPQNFIINNFLGIRGRNGVTGTNNTVSATRAVNIEIEPTDDDSYVNIRSVLGNIMLGQLPAYKIIDIFETIQDGVKYFICYCENNKEGVLYRFEMSGTNFVKIVGGLTVTGEANGITMIDSAYDVFVFTNGIEYKSVCFAKNPIVESIIPIYNNFPVTGMALAEQGGSLVIGSQKQGIVIASRKGDILDWDYVKPAEDKTKPWYQLFGKGVTSVVPYIEGLLVFTAEDSTMLIGNMSSLDFERSSASLGGCYSYKSWCLHDKYIFFYDNKQKNIYYYLQNDVGQKILGEAVASNIQKYFDNPQKVKLLSYIGQNKSEIWVKIDDTVLIFNWSIKEWTERSQNKVNSFNIYDFGIYSCDDKGKIFKERAVGATNCVFDGQFIGASYRTPYLNMGSFSNLKEIDMMPIVTYGKSHNNSFSTIFDTGKKQKIKRYELYQGFDFTWSDDSTPLAEIPEREKWENANFPNENSYLTGNVKAKCPNSFYYVGVEFFTQKVGDDFCIRQLEFKEMTQETDTRGLR